MTESEQMLQLSGYKIVLASASPRRKQLLAMLGLPFTVRRMEGVDESYPEDLVAEEVAEYIAGKKCQEGRRTMRPGELLICADTVVIVDGRILGKPHSSEEARQMLRSLSGRTHKVITGVAVTDGEKMRSESVETMVNFAPLAQWQIDYYVDTYNPLDKAGAYGIQEWIGAVGVRGIEGSFYNVMGLPVHRLYQILVNWSTDSNSAD